MRSINIHFTVNPFAFNTDCICKLLYLIVRHYQNNFFCTLLTKKYSNDFSNHFVKENIMCRSEQVGEMENKIFMKK